MDGANQTKYGNIRKYTECIQKCVVSGNNKSDWESRLFPAQTIDRERKKSQNEMAGIQASLRKTEIKCSNLEKSLAAKVKENEELTLICDELIAKVGKN